MKRITYHIQGMHCSACASFIERSVEKLKGINKAKVSIPKSQIVIEAESHHSIPSLYKLNQMFKESGYTFSDHHQEETVPLKNLLAIGAIFLLIVAFFFLSNKSQFLSNLYVDSASNLPAFFLFGIAAGLSSCAALVGSLLLSVQESWVGSNLVGNKKQFIPFMIFNASRLVTFAILGGLLGTLGGIFKLSLKMSSILTILISILMIIISMQMLGVKMFQKIPINFSGRFVNSLTTGNKIKSTLMPTVFGAVTFFVPCGFTLIAQTQALESGSFFRGASILIAFALGTLPVLLLISLSSVKFYKNPRFSRSFRILSGLLILFFAIFTINSQFGFLYSPNTGKAINAQEAAEADPQINTKGETSQTQETIPSSQILQMEVKGFEYFPKTITIKAGIPTKFEVTDNGSTGCARAVYAKGLYPEVIVLEPGLNVVDIGSPSAGIYQISCSMWMVEPITVIVE